MRAGSNELGFMEGPACPGLLRPSSPDGAEPGKGRERGADR